MARSYLVHKERELANKVRLNARLKSKDKGRGDTVRKERRVLVLW